MTASDWRTESLTPEMLERLRAQLMQVKPPVFLRPETAIRLIDEIERLRAEVTR